jgi:hypothetical protein
MLYDGLIYFGTVVGIHVLSTIPERLVAFVLLFFVLYSLSKRLASTKKKWITAGFTAAIITAVFGIYLRTTMIVFLTPVFIITVITLFLFSMRMAFTKRRKIISVVIAGMITFFISSIDLTDLHRAVLADPAVVKFAKGHFNSMGLDTDSSTLYVIGDGVNHIHAYNISALDSPPRLSEIITGKAELFLYHDRAREIYLLHKIKNGRMTQQLRILDAPTMTIKESISLQFPPGVSDDAWIEVDEQTNHIVVAAEAGAKKLDNATMIIDRETGKIIKKVSLSPTNIMLHPSRPLLYMSYFQGRESNEIIMYDLEALSIVNQRTLPVRMDRMEFVEPANELLVTVPAKAMIYRLDADTLAVKGIIKSSLGVRTLKVDAKRNLLLTLSLVTNILDVIDLSTHQSINKYYLAPWLRSIVIDGKGTAYVSSFTGLFRVRYAQAEQVY